MGPHLPHAPHTALHSSLMNTSSLVVSMTLSGNVMGEFLTSALGGQVGLSSLHMAVPAGNSWTEVQDYLYKGTEQGRNLARRTPIVHSHFSNCH